MAEKEPTRVPARWDPFDELDFFRGLGPFRGFSGGLGRLLDERGVRLTPAVDITEDDSGYFVTVEVPGATKDDITVEAHEGVLTIRGEKRNEREERKEHSRWVERAYGSFSRSFTLPPNAETERVKASFTDGVLTVEIPKAEEKKPRVISIRS